VGVLAGCEAGSETINVAKGALVPLKEINLKPTRENSALLTDN
jgi:hypothetical protein